MDCNILRNIDWEEQLGDAEITCTRYVPPVANEKGDIPDFGELISVTKDDLPIPESWSDNLPSVEVDVSEFTIGDVYPGRYDGKRLGVDTQSRPFIKHSTYGRIILENAVLEAAAIELRKTKTGGALMVTAQGHLITRLKDGTTIFLGEFDREILDNVIDQAVEMRKNQPKRIRRTFDEMFG